MSGPFMNLTNERKRMAIENDHFNMQWRMPGTVAEVAEILRNGADYARWWPAAVIDSYSLRQGDAREGGVVYALRVKGWLPFTWTIQCRSIGAAQDLQTVFSCTGDLIGTGSWSLRQDGPLVTIGWEWSLHPARRARLVGASLGPWLLASNYAWGMRKGEESLRILLARRRATSADARALIPHPPLHFPVAPFALAGATFALALLIGVGALLRRRAV